MLVSASSEKFDLEKGHSAEAPKLRRAAYVDDMDAAVANLTEHDVPILRGPLSIEGEVRWLYFADLDNNIIEFVQWLQNK